LLKETNENKEFFTKSIIPIEFTKNSLKLKRKSDKLIMKNFFKQRVRRKNKEDL
jgi:hypothetical protein